MEVASPQHLGDSFSRGWLNCGAQAPSFERLVDADLRGHSFGSSRSFIDMDPAKLFSMRWTTTATTAPASDFDFGLPGDGTGSGPPSPMLASASQIIRNGRLLPSEPVGLSVLQEHGDRVTELPSAPRSSTSSPLHHSAQSKRIIAGHKSARPPPHSGRRGRASSWKILLRYLRFLMPLYRKVRTLRRFAAPRPRVAPASPARASTSSIEWCHGNADTAVRDAILYCKKSSVCPLN
uniref:Membrane-associated kinase regulator 6 n=1 Tax=Arundo donax TaxID=35708 RepID=A0A0A9D4B6_ARUDO